MAELKTQATKASVEKFIKGITDEQVRGDCLQIMDIMKKPRKPNLKCGAQA